MRGREAANTSSKLRFLAGTLRGWRENLFQKDFSPDFSFSRTRLSDNINPLITYGFSPRRHFFRMTALCRLPDRNPD
ncbi:MAG: hypothetical protein P8Y64_05840 [Gammaproteobacteria bacterium]|jgi:hypothetical protein